MTGDRFSSENSVIGSLLIAPQTLPLISSYLAPEDFLSRMAETAYRAALALETRGDPVDVLLILSEMVKGGYSEPEAVQYLAGCMDVTPTAANVEVYCKLVKDDARRRTLSKVADDISGGVLLGRDWQEILNESLAALGGVGSSGAQDLSIGKTAYDWAQYVTVVRKDPRKAFCPTGFKTLDAALGGGMFNSGVYIIAARPGMGKTTLGIAIAERVSQDSSVLFVSLEMSRTQVFTKLIAAKTGLSYTNLLGGRIRDDEFNLALDAAAALSNNNFYICDESLTIPQITERARGIKDLSLIVIDYLGLIPTHDEFLSTRDQITAVSASVKAAAKSLNIPIALLCQINRDSTKRTDKRPTMADLRDSGAIEQDADAVILLHRESYYDRDVSPETEEIELIIDKDRHAAPTKVIMNWKGSTGEIYDLGEDDIL
jgi:replicative DNA helicase